MRKIGKDLKSNDLENEIKFESHLGFVCEFGGEGKGRKG
jgi:hypothetical protein